MCFYFVSKYFIQNHSPKTEPKGKKICHTDSTVKITLCFVLKESLSYLDLGFDLSYKIHKKGQVKPLANPKKGNN